MPRRKREEPQEPPVLRLEKGDAEWAEEVLSRVEEMLREVGDSPKRAQLLTMLVNPAHRGSAVRWRDHTNRPRLVESLASRAARARREAIRGLRPEEGTRMSRDEVARLIGLTEDAIKAIEDRADHKRPTQVRVSRSDFALLQAAKTATEEERARPERP